MACDKNVLLGLAAVVLLAVVLYNCSEKFTAKSTEGFTSDQLLLNAKNYTFVPQQRNSAMLPQARPDFATMTCGSSGLPQELRGMSAEQIKSEIDLHYRKPMELLTADTLLPETDLSGINFTNDPATDFANKFVWHRTTHANLKRRNWESGAAMIRGDLPGILPNSRGWFTSPLDQRDLNTGFIPTQYCGQVSVEDTFWNMPKIY